MANTAELVLPLAHTLVHNPNGKSIGSAISAQLNDRKSLGLYFTVGDLIPPKLPLLTGHLEPI